MRATLVILCSAGFKIYVLAQCALRISEYMINSWQMWFYEVFSMDLLHDTGILHISGRMGRNSVDTFLIFLRWSETGSSLVYNYCGLKIVHLLFCVSNFHYTISSPSERHWQLSRTSVLVLCSLVHRLNFLLLSRLSQPSWLTSPTYEYMHMQICISYIHTLLFSHWK